MEPFSALTVATAVVQFVDFGIKITELTRGFYKNHGELPHDIARVKLIVDDLVPLIQRIRQTQDGQDSVFESIREEKFAALLTASVKEAKSFTDILSTLNVTDKHKGTGSFRAALRTFRKAGEIERIEKALEGYRLAILLHLTEATLGQV